MEEKDLNRNKNQSSIESKNNLYLFDDIYYKIQSQNKSLRCISAKAQPKFLYNNLKNIKNNLNNNYYDILQMQNNNISQNLEFIPSKSRNKLNFRLKAINLSSNFKSNDSKLKSDSTKTTSKRTQLKTGKYNLNLTVKKLNNSSLDESKKLPSLKNNNRFSMINLKVDNFHKNNQIFKKQSLKDFTLQHFTNKLITEKIKKHNANQNSLEKDKIKFSKNYPRLDSYKSSKNKKTINKENKKNSKVNKRKKYSIKYSFLENIMNNIFHTVNFVDIENKEEFNQKVLNEINHEEDFKLEDFKTIGYELDPEILNKINQNKKQKFIKLKYEELKKNYSLENLKNKNANNIKRKKSKKQYIPEYKLKPKYENMKNKAYESIYLIKPVTYSEIMEKIIFKHKKEFINTNFDSKQLNNNNSGILSHKIPKVLEKINIKSNNKSQPNINEIDERKNKQTSQILFNNVNNPKINYANIFLNNRKNQMKNKIKKKIMNRDIKNMLKTLKNSLIDINVDNRDNENIINYKKEDKFIRNSISNNDNFNDDMSKFNPVNHNNHINNINNNNKSKKRKESNDIKIIYQKEKNKNYSIDNNLVKTDNIFSKIGEKYKFELLDLTNSSNKITSIKKYKKNKSFDSLLENHILLNNKDKKNKGKYSKKIFSDTNIKQKFIIFGNPYKNSNSKILILKNKIFKEKEENKQNINKSKDENIKEKIKSNIEEKNKSNSLNKDESIEKNKKFKEYIIQKEKMLKEQLHQKDFFHKISQYLKSNKSYKKLYPTQNELTEGFNKIALNFISSKPNYSIDKQTNIKFLNKKEKKLNKSEGESDQSFQKSKNKSSFYKSGHEKKSSTIDYINQKYKELKSKNVIVNIHKELAKNLKKFKIFQDVNLESYEDIENKKMLLLLRLRENIKYNILKGKCEKKEMDEYIKFENELDSDKKNYNLRDKTKLEEYTLLLLMKFNEFIELYEIRENQKIKENRINKFLNDLNFDLHYNIPFSITIKGRKCYSRNFNGNFSSLSEIKK